MKLPARVMAVTMTAALIVSACSGSSATFPGIRASDSSVVPPPATPVVAPTNSLTDQSAAPTAVATPSPVAPAVPPAPTGTSAAQQAGTVPCPTSPSVDCKQTIISWSFSGDATAWFHLYRAPIGLDPDATCDSVLGDAKMVVETKPAAKTAAFYAEVATGAGDCFWVTAVNTAGESGKVAVTQQ